MTDHTLMVLSPCARQLIEVRQKRKTFFSRIFIINLVQLLQEAIPGQASTVCFVCLSPVPADLIQSKVCLGCMSGKCLPSTGNDNETDCRLCAEGKCLSTAG